MIPRYSRKEMTDIWEPATKFRIWFEIEAHANGKIVNELSDDRATKAKYGPSSDLEFSINGGDADIEMDTISGRIELRKQK